MSMKPFHRFRPHPWHGLETGLQPPDLVCAFIEITPEVLSRVFGTQHGLFVHDHDH